MTSIKYTLYSDLDGKSVAEIRAMLAEYPDDYRVDVRSRPIDNYVDEEFFVIEPAD